MAVTCAFNNSIYCITVYILRRLCSDSGRFYSKTAVELYGVYRYGYMDMNMNETKPLKKSVGAFKNLLTEPFFEA